MDKELPHASSFYANKNMKISLNLAVTNLNFLFCKHFFTSNILRVKCKNIKMTPTPNPQDPGSSPSQVIFVFLTLKKLFFISGFIVQFFFFGQKNY